MKNTTMAFLLVVIALLLAFLTPGGDLALAQESETVSETASEMETVSDAPASQVKGGGEKGMVDKVKNFFNSLKNETKWINIQNAFMGAVAGENIPKLIGVFVVLTFIGYIPCYFAMGKIDVNLHPETVVSQFYKIFIFCLFASWTTSIYFTKDIMRIFNLYVTIEFFMILIYMFFIFEAFSLKSSADAESDD